MSWLFWIISWLVITTGVTGPVLYICVDSDGCSAVNPLWIYEHYKVNWFGAMWLCIFYHLLAPVYAICYWFYKLCTIGRR